MAPETGRRVDLAVDLMLADVIPSVGQRSGGRTFIFIARVQFFLVGMTVRAERFFMAHVADILPLLCYEFVT
jgi:hypothetical protein